MSDGEYPKSVYRPGDEGEWDGVKMDFGTVTDAADEEAALAKGWFLHPSKFPQAEHITEAPKGGLLDQNARDIEKALPSLSIEALEKLKGDEEAGKSRIGVLRDIDAAINAKLAA
jgi:hypothetical protein